MPPCITPPMTTVARFSNHARSKRTVPYQAPTTNGSAYAPTRKTASRWRLRTSPRSMRLWTSVVSEAISGSWPASPTTRPVLRMTKRPERSRDSRPHSRRNRPAWGLPPGPLRHRELSLRLGPLLRPHDLALTPQDLEGQPLVGVHALAIDLVPA